MANSALDAHPLYQRLKTLLQEAKTLGDRMEGEIMPLIAYYRVSTPEQGVSGLGLEAQRAAVYRYALLVGETIRAEFTDILSRRKDRPEFNARGDAKRLRDQMVRLFRSRARLRNHILGVSSFT